MMSYHANHTTPCILTRMSCTSHHMRSARRRAIRPPRQPGLKAGVLRRGPRAGRTAGEPRAPPAVGGAAGDKESGGAGSVSLRVGCHFDARAATSRHLHLTGAVAATPLLRYSLVWIRTAHARVNVPERCARRGARRARSVAQLHGVCVIQKQGRWRTAVCVRGACQCATLRQHLCGSPGEMACAAWASGRVGGRGNMCSRSRDLMISFDAMGCQRKASGQQASTPLRSQSREVRESRHTKGLLVKDD